MRLKLVTKLASGGAIVSISSRIKLKCIQYIQPLVRKKKKKNILFIRSFLLMDFFSCQGVTTFFAICRDILGIEGQVFKLLVVSDSSVRCVLILFLIAFF